MIHDPSCNRLKTAGATVRHPQRGKNATGKAVGERFPRGVVINMTPQPGCDLERVWLVFRSADSRTKSVQLFEDGIGGSGPHEWFAVFVVVGNELIDTRDQLFDRAK